MISKQAYKYLRYFIKSRPMLTDIDWECTSIIRYIINLHHQVSIPLAVLAYTYLINGNTFWEKYLE